jgi:O-antigen ligase
VRQSFASSARKSGESRAQNRALLKCLSFKNLSPLRNVRVLPLLLIMAAPLIGGHRDISGELRSLVMWCAAFGLLMLVIARTDAAAGAGWRSLTQFPIAPAPAYLGWLFALYIFRTPATGLEHGLALAELLRIGCGVILFVAVRNAYPTRRQLRAVVWAIVICAAIDAVAGILSARPQLDHPASASYGNKELLAAFLVALAPFAAVIVMTGTSKSLRVTAAITVALLIAALLLTGNRTSWIATGVGLLAAAMLAPRRGHTLKLAYSAIIAACVAGGAWALIGNGSAFLRSRAAADLGNLHARIPLWRAALGMSATYPITGIGLGAYPLHAYDFSGNNPDIPTAAQVTRQRVSISNVAHNEYLQTAAETGIIGLGLYLAVLISFLILGLRTWRVMPDGIRRSLLAGALAAVLAQCIDAMANPGWRFADVDPILWLMLGVGASAIGRPRWLLANNKKAAAASNLDHRKGKEERTCESQINLQHT